MDSRKGRKGNCSTDFVLLTATGTPFFVFCPSRILSLRPLRTFARHFIVGTVSYRLYDCFGNIGCFGFSDPEIRASYFCVLYFTASA